jgi:hypothetical protein
MKRGTAEKGGHSAFTTAPCSIAIVNKALCPPFLSPDFGIDLPKPMWSSYRAQQKARDNKHAPKGKSGRKPKVAEPGRVARSSNSEPAGDNGMIDDLTAVKHLVQRLGAEQVKKIVGLFE